ncbi:hypothetical protein ACFV0T_06075 [Streptomyces sp. NPDC059582]|uniref:hypothetical protein n=1 Tax=Streptomyces sp. NPDC059582 TaxID=3346875 RepID=UPI0036C52BEC
MDVMFYVVPGLIMAVTVFAAYRVLRRTVQLRMAWNSGLTAEARCLRAFTTVHGGTNDSSVRTTLHHVYEFTARDGRTVRFEEEDGPATVVEGDYITVHYKEGPREVIATALAPRKAKQAAATVAMLALLGVVLGFCVAFMVTYTHAAASAGDVGF